MPTMLAYSATDIRVLRAVANKIYDLASTIETAKWRAKYPYFVSRPSEFEKVIADSIIVLAGVISNEAEPA